MDSISIYDGLILTVISMMVVFIVLAAIWGLIEITSRLVGGTETMTESIDKQAAPEKTGGPVVLTPNKKPRTAAEMIALILASEDEPDKKFEITESKRVQ